MEFEVILQKISPFVPIHSRTNPIYVIPCCFSDPFSFVLLSNSRSFKWLFPSRFPTRILYGYLVCPIRATCPVHLVFLDFISQRIVDVKYKHGAHHYPISSCLLLLPPPPLDFSSYSVDPQIESPTSTAGLRRYPQNPCPILTAARIKKAVMSLPSDHLVQHHYQRSYFSFFLAYTFGFHLNFLSTCFTLRVSHVWTTSHAKLNGSLALGDARSSFSHRLPYVSISVCNSCPSKHQNIIKAFDTYQEPV